MRRLMLGFFAVGMFSMVVSCGNKGTGTASGSEPFGHLSMAVTSCGPHYDVASVQIKIFKDTTKECTDDADFEHTSGLICIPDTISDSLFVLAAGDYKVCAIPLQDDGTASKICSPVVSSPVTITPEVVQEITLTSLCTNPNGGLDVITNFEDLVLITGLTIEPFKFVDACQTATITIGVDDPNVVNTYVWTITQQPLGSNPVLNQPDPTNTPWIAEFTSDMTGLYWVQVDVTNPLGNTTSLKQIPIHVVTSCAQGQVCCSGTCKDTCDVCGDGVVTGTETCDTAITSDPGVCPTIASCEAANPNHCNVQGVEGDPCHTHCVTVSVITECGPDDGCCPSITCYSNQDPNCGANPPL